MNHSSPAPNNQAGSLDIRDLLGDVQAEYLSDYLTLSIRSEFTDAAKRNHGQYLPRFDSLIRLGWQAIPRAAGRRKFAS